MDLGDLLFGGELPFLEDTPLDPRGIAQLTQYIAVDEAERRLSNRIGQRVKQEVEPQLKTIVKMLKRTKHQTVATDEHNIINNTAQFRRKVLSDLYTIAGQLPRNHPVRQQIHSRLGLL